MKRQNLLSSTPHRLVLMGCWILLVVCVRGFAQIEYSVSTPVNSYQVHQVVGPDGKLYEKYSLDKGRYPDHVGSPNLPMKTVHLLVASSDVVDKVELVDDTQIPLTGAHRILPVQPPRSVTQQGTFGGENLFVKGDSVIYGSNQSFPIKTVSILNDGFFDGSNHIVTLSVSPFQYRPVTGELTLHTNLRFRLEMKQGPVHYSQVQSRSESDQRIYDAYLRQIINNPEAIPMFQVRPAVVSDKTTLEKTTTTLPHYTYVVVAPDSFRSHFAPLIAWKRMKGLNAGFVSISDILPNAA